MSNEIVTVGAAEALADMKVLWTQTKDLKKVLFAMAAQKFFDRYGDINDGDYLFVRDEWAFLADPFKALSLSKQADLLVALLDRGLITGSSEKLEYLVHSLVFAIKTFEEQDAEAYHIHKLIDSYLSEAGLRREYLPGLIYVAEHLRDLLAK